jgi:transglutaminase/protease-like cytokinesis protein 3
LVDERLASVGTQFAERDTRSERESRDNKVAVDAAFAAQKEAASEQNKSNTLAISKSEAATSETINKLSELFRTTTDGLASSILDVKDQVRDIRASKSGAAEAVSAKRQDWAAVYGLAAFLLVLLMIGSILAAFLTR